MLNIGCHLSSAKGYLHMLQETESIGGNTFQFFTRNPRGGQAKPIDPEDAAAFRTEAEEKKFAQILAQGIEAGIEMIAAMLNEILKPEMHTTVLLETMAGKGSEIGSRFEELRAIMDRVTLSEKLGICLDTCHVYDAGYDIVGDLDGVLETFDAIIGLDKLKAIHINDSKNPYASHKDRHEKIGEGSIGTDAFRRIITHEKLRGLPFLLETPNELDGYKAEITLLKELYNASPFSAAI